MEPNRIILILRHPEDQLLSCLNRWKAVGMSNEPFRRLLPSYLAKMREWAMRGARVQFYESLTTIPVVQQQLAKSLQTDWLGEHGSERLNTHPKTIERLPAWTRTFVEQMHDGYRNIRDAADR